MAGGTFFGRARRLLAAIALLSGSVSATELPSKPNILFLFPDGQSYKTVRCYPESGGRGGMVQEQVTQVWGDGVMNGLRAKNAQSIKSLSCNELMDYIALRDTHTTLGRRGTRGRLAPSWGR
jgi:hypothetical protein